MGPVLRASDALSVYITPGFRNWCGDIVKNEHFTPSVRVNAPVRQREVSLFPQWHHPLLSKGKTWEQITFSIFSVVRTTDSV